MDLIYGHQKKKKKKKNDYDLTIQALDILMLCDMSNANCTIE